jgi:hypothetical protein
MIEAITHTTKKVKILMAFVSKSVSMTIQLIFHMILIILLTFIEMTLGLCNHWSFPYRDIAATLPNSPHHLGTQSDCWRIMRAMVWTP